MVKVRSRPRATRCRALLWAVFSFLGAASLQAVPATPEPVDFGLQDTEPYQWNGRVQVSFGWGSGFAVDRRVFLTAGHVGLNPSTYTWTTNITWHYRRNSIFTQDTQRMAGGTGFTSYAARAETDDEDGFCCGPETFNLDVSAVYALEDLEGGYGPAWFYNSTEESPILADGVKTLVGYPSNTVPSSQIGRMFQTEPAAYHFYRFVSREFPLDLDAGGFRNSLFESLDVQSYQGNSGGPLYIEDYNGELLPSAVFVGGNDRVVIMRSLNQEVLDIVEDAALASGRPGGLPVRGLTARLLNDSAALVEWQTSRALLETASNEWVDATVFIERRTLSDNSSWDVVGRTRLDAGWWADGSLELDHDYQYRVRVDLPDERPSASNIATVAAGRSATEPLSEALGTNLALATGGDAPFSVTSGQSRSGGTSVINGDIENQSHVWLHTTVVGPADLNFAWRSSTEPGEDGTFGYDNFKLYVNGVLDREIFGDTEWQDETLILGEGVHTVRWAYIKDWGDPDFFPWADTVWLDDVLLSPVENGESRWRDVQFPATVLLSSEAEATVWGDAADPDRDGIANMIEFAASQLPLVADERTAEAASILGVIEVDPQLVGGLATLEYTRTAGGDGLVRQLEYASHPDGPWSSEGVIEVPVSSDGESETFRLEAPASTEPGRFFRLRLERE